ncbi:immunodominant staphylococcal antigen IsaB family protein [Mammaliicoccus sp. Dog046]|uniref:immunodominant staphylococcal antigen IsaB family protein n=1 Tax=Mammaliicoccus sp. Dog046 TaxID=3034233 RepID=UPI002B25EB4B|nr:hypothetical protein [Mammaliicoccus sp. Dog046]WQK85122.1 hypothetical protein P3U32_10885 [Mammaliicoccus sp. Dog046]
MRKTGKILSATIVVSALVAGSSTPFISSNDSTAQAAEQTQKWGHGEGGSSGTNAQSTKESSEQIPWYQYEGYTTYDPSFTQDYNFVRALKYDNVTIDGYKVDPNAAKDFDHSVNLYDTTVNFNDKDEVIKVTFLTKPNSVTKAEFKNAHASNAGSEAASDDGSTISYNTNDGLYTAFFDEDGYLTKMSIG